MTIGKLIPMRDMTLYYVSTTFNLEDYLGSDTTIKHHNP